MTIPVKKEPKMTPFGFEKCVFCGQTTVYWHLKTNNPICKLCAKIHKVCELINWFKK